MLNKVREREEVRLLMPTKECARLKLETGKVRAFLLEGDGDDIQDVVLLDEKKTLEEAQLGAGERVCVQVKKKNEVLELLLLGTF